jgi:hypothetical protein
MWLNAAEIADAARLVEYAKCRAGNDVRRSPGEIGATQGGLASDRTMSPFGSRATVGGFREVVTAITEP